MGLGVLCMISAAFLLFSTEIEERNAEEFTRNVVISFGEQMEIEDFSQEDTNMDFLTIDGENYMGILLIPQLELELPVAITCTSGLLKNTPCVFRGSVEDENLIIAAHNYQSHFGNIGELVSGDEINLVDPVGNVLTYRLVDEEIIDGNDLVGLEEGNWDLTLFTCVYSNNTKRRVLRFINCN